MRDHRWMRRPSLLQLESEAALIEIEIQNETHQTQFKIKVLAVPRIGEGIRLLEEDGLWASYDILDVWYQKAEYGDVWTPYIHVRITPGEAGRPTVQPDVSVLFEAI